jgi:hypothetical protein
MAIKDYFGDIHVLEQIGSQAGRSNQIGGRDRQWNIISTIQGVINQAYSNQDNSRGKEGEQSEYKGFFEYSSTNLDYLEGKYRLKDSEGHVYKIKGKAKNTINRNHHLKCDLTFDSYIK